MPKHVLLKGLMRLFENIPDPGDHHLQEIFSHRLFTEADEATRRAILTQSSETAYRDEIEYPMDNYFMIDLRPLLNDKVVLDIGCFNGGRCVAWHERYHFRTVYGIDIDTRYIEAAVNFAKMKKVSSEFICGNGEDLPFSDSAFDAVVSYNVFEHVRDLAGVLNECRRVLKRGGRLFAVFPGYYHPTEHHLILATRAPFVHHLFSAKTITQAYDDIIDERGEDAYWYKREKRGLDTWEKLPFLNGTTLRRFRHIIRDSGFTVDHRACFTLLGRRHRYRFLSALIYPLARLPFVEEVLCGRMIYILRK